MVVATKITRHEIGQNLTRQKSQEFEFDWEQVQNIKIYTYFDTHPAEIKLTESNSVKPSSTHG
jgi:hypothetical protein